MDLTTGIAVHTHMPPGRYSPHLQASYRFMRPAVPDAALTCRGTVLSLGRRFGTARCELRDEGDRLLATGETTHAIAGEDR
jgi:acyl-coenzyme A thioesterase PaaI-like protein